MSLAVVVAVVGALTLAVPIDPAGALVGVNVCTYDADTGAGAAFQDDPVTDGGHTVDAIAAPTAANLNGCDVLFAEVGPGVPPAEWTNNLGAIGAAVNGGMRLVVHDHDPGANGPTIPGMGGTTCTTDTTGADAAAVQLDNAPNAWLANPFGQLTDASLDGGDPSTSGFCAEATLPAGTSTILSRASNTESVAFGYPRGGGHVYYSTIPLGRYLTGVGAQPPRTTVNDVYAPNTIHYALTTVPGQTFAVTTTNDTVDASIGDGECEDASGLCSLRAAIQEANATAARDTIVLYQATFALTRNGAGEDQAATGDLDITESISIEAWRSVITAAPVTDRVFDVHPGADAQFWGPNITGGDVAGVGGGFRSTGILAVSNLSVHGNEAAGGGGGIHATGPVTIIENITVTDNTSATDGKAGGIDVQGGEHFVGNVTVAANTNTAGGPGGMRLAPDIASSSEGNLIALNTTVGTASGVDCDLTSGLLTVTESLIGTGTNCGVTNGVDGNLVGTTAAPIAPRLKPFGDYDGPNTMPPLPASPAFDGMSGPCKADIDARDVDRPRFDECDMGAVEITEPDPPASVEAVSGDGIAFLDWSAVTPFDGPRTGYEVTIASTTAGGGPGVGQVVCTTDQNACEVDGLVVGATYTFDVVTETGYGPSATATTSNPVQISTAPPPSRGPEYVPLTPARVLDTRNGIGTGAAPVGPGTEITVQIGGVAGVPADDVEAVVLNVTSTTSDTASFVTVWPSDAPRPTASNLNTDPGQDTPNLVIVKVGADGRIKLYNNAGTGHLVADVQGYFPAGSAFVPQSPVRALDTRSGLGVPAGALGPAETVNLRLAGAAGVPAADVGAVVLNVTSTESDTPSFITVWPSGRSRPVASNLNTEPSQDTPNLVITQIDSTGVVSLYNNAGTGHLVGDVAGWFPTSADFQGLTPARVLDTRNGIGTPAGRVGPQGEITLDVTGVGGVPGTGVGAVVLNVTSTESDTPSFITVWPAGQPRPVASNLNTDPGQDTPNLVIAKVGANGSVLLFNNAGTGHLVADVLGYFPEA